VEYKICSTSPCRRSGVNRIGTPEATIFVETGMFYTYGFHGYRGTFLTACEDGMGRYFESTAKDCTVSSGCSWRDNIALGNVGP
jgi:hypothetical protein